MLFEHSHSPRPRCNIGGNKVVPRESRPCPEIVQAEDGFFVIKNLCGHGIGRELHEDPEILNYGTRHSGPEIKPGMVFCLEPMVAVGTGEIKKAKDGQAYVTADGSLSAHFEHTIVATKNGAKVLTVI